MIRAILFVLFFIIMAVAIALIIVGGYKTYNRDSDEKSPLVVYFQESLPSLFH